VGEKRKKGDSMNLSNSSRRRQSITSLKTTIPLAFKMVFPNPIYIAIASAVFTTFWIVFNVLDQLLFFSPVFTFYLPDDAIAGFIITNITSALMGILVAMNVYVIRNSGIKLDRSLFSGSILGIASSACASCSSIGFLIISTLGGFGIFATDFLTNYQTPLRVVSIAILLWALYSVHNKITKPCILDSSYPKRNGETQRKRQPQQQQQQKITSSTSTLKTEKDPTLTRDDII